MSDDLNEKMLQIGEVGERVGLSLRSVRFYEESGLLEPAARTEGGFRLYTETQVNRLLLIKRMKPLGFSVEQMRDLLGAYDRLHDQDLDSDAHERARSELKTYANLAKDRCDELRKQLSRAEEFAERLNLETGM